MRDLPQEHLIENMKPLPLPVAKQLPEATSLRQGAELALKDNWFRSAFEYAAIGMALADLDGRCLAANRSLGDPARIRQRRKTGWKKRR